MSPLSSCPEDVTLSIISWVAQLSHRTTDTVYSPTARIPWAAAWNCYVLAPTNNKSAWLRQWRSCAFGGLRNLETNTNNLIRTHQLWINTSDRVFSEMNACLDVIATTPSSLTRKLMCLGFITSAHLVMDSTPAITRRLNNLSDWVIPFILALTAKGKTFRCRLAFHQGVTRKNGQVCTLVIVPVIRKNGKECIRINRVYHVNSAVTFTVSDADVVPGRQTSLLFADAVQRSALLLTTPNVSWWKPTDD
jgi:hypothetical protein